jgi:hypothetical protein
MLRFQIVKMTVASRPHITITTPARQAASRLDALAPPATMSISASFGFLRGSRHYTPLGLQDDSNHPTAITTAIPNSTSLSSSDQPTMSSPSRPTVRSRAHSARRTVASTNPALGPACMCPSLCVSLSLCVCVCVCVGVGVGVDACVSVGVGVCGGGVYT